LNLLPVYSSSMNNMTCLL